MSEPRDPNETLELLLTPEKAAPLEVGEPLNFEGRRYRVAAKMLRVDGNYYVRIVLASQMGGLI